MKFFETPDYEEGLRQSCLEAARKARQAGIPSTYADENGLFRVWPDGSVERLVTHASKDGLRP